jgi:hypothetical protein
MAAAEAASRWHAEPEEVTSIEQLENLVDDTVRQLQEIADFSTPRAKAGTGRRAGWWDGETAQAVQAARKAGRRWRAERTRRSRGAFDEAIRDQAKAIRSSQRRYWRRTVEEASEDSKLLWKLERWARIRSHAPAEQPKLPQLKRSEGDRPATAHAEKAEILAERFFPNLAADLTDVADTTFQDHTFSPAFELSQEVSEQDIKEALKAGPWKAPGADGLPMGFLKACGKPLRKVLAAIATASFRLEHFPRRLRHAVVIVLRKPGKTVDEQQYAGAWRPISLLNTMGKVVEAVLGRRVAFAAERHRLLPEMQMGNRPHRSTELAVRLVTDVVHTAWRHGAIASLAQLDIKGAFDTVNYTRLLDTLRGMGFQPWAARWIRSYLTERTAKLWFDGEDSEVIQIRAGVPQGSPLSPILFILYTSSLYAELATHEGLASVGFADDLNLVAVARNAKDTKQVLEKAWETCSKWALKRGMQFAPNKTELLHFTRARAPITQRVRIGDTEVEPQTSARFLGVWLDRKLRWSAHLGQIRRKLQTQKFALTRIAASTWGCSLDRARLVYVVAIRSAMVYGASAYHTPSKNGKAQGVARSLATAQSQCLRVVAGAYKATPVRQLETETHTPPIDIYLDMRLADFEERLQRTGKARLIRDTCTAIVRALRRRKGRGRPRKLKPVDPSSGPAKAEWAAAWARQGGTLDAAERDWKQRWQRLTQGRRAYTEPADKPDFTKEVLKKHRGLRKHESAALTQLRTGRIGLKAFLFEQRVPDIMTPNCSCGVAETPTHVFLDCRRTEAARRELTMRTRRDLHAQLTNPQTTGYLTRWFLRLGLLRQFDLAEALLRQQGRDQSTK